MLSLIILKFGHSIWSKRKLKKLESVNNHILTIEKRNKRHSFYVEMKHKRDTIKKRKSITKTTIYAKILNK